MPFAVADSLVARGINPVLFAIARRLRSGAGGAFSPSLDFGRPDRPGGEAVSRRELPRSGFHRHAGAARRCRRSGSTGARCASSAGCWAAFRGGDDHLLSGIGRILEQDGFRMVGIKDVAPDLLMPEGCLTRAAPDDNAAADIAKGREVLRALESVRYRPGRGRDRRPCGRGRRHRGHRRVAGAGGAAARARAASGPRPGAACW